jgi:hypothetical protein
VSENVCLYNDAGIPFSNSLQKYCELICEAELHQSEVLFGIFTNTEMDKNEGKLDPTHGPHQVFIRY